MSFTWEGAVTSAGFALALDAAGGTCNTGGGSGGGEGPS